LRQFRSQYGLPGDVHALLADLIDAAHDDILDQRRIDPRSIEHAIDRARSEVCGMHARQFAFAATACGADGGDHIGLTQFLSPEQLFKQSWRR
jgi:hypothetical protein